MNKFFLPLVTFLVLSLAACNNSQQGDQSKDSMADMASDTSFRDAHQQPDSLAFQGKGEMTEFATPDGGKAKAYALKSSTPSNKYLFVIHEWWGLNDHIKQEAEHLFDNLDNVNVMALDMYDGQVTADKDEAGKIMGAVKPERLEAIVKGALAVAGKDAKIATIGWCFGGGWSLRSSILAGDQGVGCVMYYGMPVEKANELAPLKAPVLGIFAKKDGWINEPVIDKFKALAKATGKNLEVHWFDADHAFANPSNPGYKPEMAQEANKLALDFLKNSLK